jgi:hypothetical protein
MPVKLVSHKRREATSARKTKAQLAAETTDSEEICPDRLVKDAGAMEERSQIPSSPGPSGGSGGQLEIGAQTGVTRDAATAHLVPDDQESEDTLSVKPSKRLTTSPRKKGRFDQEHGGDRDSDRSRSGGQKSSTTGELHVQTDIQAPNMKDDGGGGDDDERNDFRLTPSGDTSLNSGGSASLSFRSDTDYLSDTYVISNAKVKWVTGNRKSTVAGSNSNNHSSFV